MKINVNQEVELNENTVFFLTRKDEKYTKYTHFETIRICGLKELKETIEICIRKGAKTTDFSVSTVLPIDMKIKAEVKVSFGEIKNEPDLTISSGLKWALVGCYPDCAGDRPRWFESLGNQILNEPNKPMALAAYNYVLSTGKIDDMKQCHAACKIRILTIMSEILEKLRLDKSLGDFNKYMKPYNAVIKKLVKG